MSTFLLTVLKLLGSILSGGLLFQAFVASNHSKPITKLAGIVVSLITLLMFVTDIKTITPNNEADKTEQLYWESVENHPSAESYRDYLLEYPDGKFKAIARLQLAGYVQRLPLPTQQKPAEPIEKPEIPVAVATNVEQIFWDIVEKHATAVMYRDYLKHYPNGKFATIARLQLANVQKAEQPTTLADHNLTDNTEQIYWQSIENHPTAELYHDYLQKYPTGQFVHTARLNLRRERQAHPSSFHTATKTNSTQADGWQSVAHFKVKDSLAKDTHSGLTWMRCAIGQHWQNNTCQGNTSDFTWQQAMEQLKDFNYAGYSDWRLPTRQELKNLVSCSDETEKSSCDQYAHVNSSTMKTVFPEPPVTVFWSASPVANGTDNAWSMVFSNGIEFTLDKANYNQVRLVRGG